MSNRNFSLALIKHIIADPGILKIVHCRWTHAYILNHRFPQSEIFHWQVARSYLLLHHRGSQTLRQKSIKNHFFNLGVNYSTNFLTVVLHKYKFSKLLSRSV